MSDLPEIQNGIYEIHNHQSGDIVFRHPVQDRSLFPKPIFALRPGIRPSGRWNVEKKSGGYILKAPNAPTGIWQRGDDEGDHVYAFIAGEKDGPVEWEITEVLTTQQRRGFIIETVLDSGKRVGWSAYGEGDQRGVQVAVRPLPAAQSFPPQYFPSDVFEFVRIDRDSD